MNGRTEAEEAASLAEEGGGGGGWGIGRMNVNVSSESGSDSQRRLSDSCR